VSAAPPRPARVLRSCRMQRPRGWPRRSPPLFALSIAAVVALCAAFARASVSIAVTWEALLGQSTAAAIVTPTESHSAWEAGRIYTYTRARVDRAVSGALAPGADVWIRTMGGEVGPVGQVVEGEPVLTVGEPSLVFLHAGPPGTLEVTARGQGQFPVVAADAKAPAHLVRSRAVGALVQPPVAVPAAPPRLAAEVLHGRPVDDAAREVAAAWDRTHAR